MDPKGQVRTPKAYREGCGLLPDVAEPGFRLLIFAWLRWLSVCLQCGDLGLIPGSGRSPGEGNGNPLQYSCLENSMDRGAWWATVHAMGSQSRTRLSYFTNGSLINVHGEGNPHTHSLSLFYLLEHSSQGTFSLLEKCLQGPFWEFRTPSTPWNNLQRKISKKRSNWGRGRGRVGCNSEREIGGKAGGTRKATGP